MNKNSILKGLCCLLCCCVMGMAVSGCSPEMRKKFVRKKKKADDSSFVPVLEPVEYANQLKTLKTRYDYFYALLKVWHKDILVLIDDEYSDKQMVYTITQMKIQLQELDKMVVGKSQEVIQRGIDEVNRILAFYDQPQAFRNRDIIRKSVQRCQKTIIKPLAYEKIQQDLKE